MTNKSFQKQIDVYISSAFSDIGEEREHMMCSLLPSLREKFAGYNIRLNFIDLRWGGDNNDSMQLCLHSIRRAAPFFIGLAGSCPMRFAERSTSPNEIAADIELRNYLATVPQDNSLFCFKASASENKDESPTAYDFKKKVTAEHRAVTYADLEQLDEAVTAHLTALILERYPQTSVAEEHEHYIRHLGDSRGQRGAASGGIFSAVGSGSKILYLGNQTVTSNNMENLYRIAYGRSICVNEPPLCEDMVNMFYVNYAPLHEINIFVMADADPRLSDTFHLKNHIIRSLSPLKMYINDDAPFMEHSENTLAANIALAKQIRDILTSDRIKRRVNIVISNLHLLRRDDPDRCLLFMPQHINPNISLLLSSSESSQFKYLNAFGHPTKSFPISASSFESEYRYRLITHLAKNKKSFNMKLIENIFNKKIVKNVSDIFLLSNFLNEAIACENLDETLEFIIGSADGDIDLFNILLRHFKRYLSDEEHSVMLNILSLVQTADISFSEADEIIHGGEKYNAQVYCKAQNAAAVFLKPTADGLTPFISLPEEFSCAISPEQSERLAAVLKNKLRSGEGKKSLLYSLCRICKRYDIPEALIDLADTPEKAVELMQLDFNCLGIILRYLKRSMLFNIKRDYSALFDIKNARRFGFETYELLAITEHNYLGTDHLAEFMDIPPNQTHSLELFFAGAAGDDPSANITERAIAAAAKGDYITFNRLLPQIGDLPPIETHILPQ